MGSVKLPFIHKLGALTGVFARLNPATLIAKIKAKRSKTEDDDELAPGDGHDDLFGDLGDLDKLDAEAAEKAAKDERAARDADADEEFDSDDELFDEDDDIDDADVLDDDADDHSDHEFADLDTDDEAPDASDAPSDAAKSSANEDLVAEIMHDLGDFDADDALEDEEDDEEAQKAKLKKLVMMAGGGVAAAVVLGGVSWWILGGESTPASEEVAALAPNASRGLVIDLDDVLPLADEKNVGATQTTSQSQMSGQTSTQGNGDGLAPPMGVNAAVSSPPAKMMNGEMGEVSELKKLGLDVQMEPGIGVVIPSVTQASYALLPIQPKTEPLQPAPIETLIEQGEHGLLPKIGPEGDTPYDAYGRPEPVQKSADPKIAIIVTGLGMSRAATEAAIVGLPADVTLSLDVYARGLDFWVKRAREAGHEVLLNMPSESTDFPFTDPGPNALKSLVPPDENIKQLEWMLSRTTGYFGVLGIYGSKFLTVEEQVEAIVTVLKRRGLMYVDGGAEDSLGSRVAYKSGAKWATVELTLDRVPGRKALERQLQELETLARKRAVTIARISPDPKSLERLVAWLGTLADKKMQLVPVSSLANKQLIR